MADFDDVQRDQLSDSLDDSTGDGVSINGPIMPESSILKEFVYSRSPVAGYELKPELVYLVEEIRDVYGASRVYKPLKSSNFATATTALPFTVEGMIGIMINESFEGDEFKLEFIQDSSTIREVKRVLSRFDMDISLMDQKLGALTNNKEGFVDQKAADKLMNWKTYYIESKNEFINRCLLLGIEIPASES